MPYLIIAEDIVDDFASNDDSNLDFVIVDIINNNEIELAFESLERAGISVFKLVDEVAIKESVNKINQMFWIIFLFVFMIIFFIINSLSRLIIIERLSVIGCLRSLGASVNMVSWIIVAENVLYGLIGGSIGGILACLLKDSISDLFFSGVAIIKSPIKFPIDKIILTTIFITVLQVLMTILPVLKSSKTSLRKLLFDQQESPYVISKKKPT